MASREQSESLQHATHSTVEHPDTSTTDSSRRREGSKVENWTIRRLRANERDRFRELHKSNILPECCYYPGELENHLANFKDYYPQLFVDEDTFDKAYYFVAVADTSEAAGDEEFLGCIALTPSEGDPSALWLGSYSVVPQQRKSGIGSALMKQATDTAREVGMSKIVLHTIGKHSKDLPAMAKARKVYERFGFKQGKWQHGLKYGDDTSVSLVWYELAL